MSQRFGIRIASPPEYERLVAEIYFGDRFVALVSEERGVGQFDLETPGLELIESSILRKVDLDGFLKAVEEARDCLSEKGPESSE